MRVRSNRELYYHQALGVLNRVPPFNACTPQELKALAELMRLSDEGYKPLINRTVNKELCEKLEINQHHLRSILYGLRKKNIIIEDSINPKLKLTYLQPLNFEFYEQKED